MPKYGNEHHAYSVYTIARQTLEGNTTYYFHKGEVLRVFLAIYGAIEAVISFAPQQLGGPGANIYAGANLYEIP